MLVIPVHTIARRLTLVTFSLVLTLNQIGNTDEAKEYAIVIHGGAGSAPNPTAAEKNQQRHTSMEQALKIGVSILEQRGTSLEAVEQVVRFL